MNKTKIEWVKNPDGSQGYTWNPITGCLNGCEYCYARKLANTRLRGAYCANSNLPTHDEPNHEAHHNDPFYPRFWPERLKELQPIGGLVCELVYPPKTRKGIFVCDMSDLFGIGIPIEWTQAVLDMIKKWPAHRFYLLTKQPQNLMKFSPFPDNCWVGVSATDNKMYEYAWRKLRDIKAKVKYISFEPLLDRIESLRFRDFQYPKDMIDRPVDWVIIGSQTKPYKLPKIEWVQEIVRACDKVGIPVFLKDNLLPVLEYEFKGVQGVDSIYARLVDGVWKLRQEMPTIH